MIRTLHKFVLVLSCWPMNTHNQGDNFDGPVLLQKYLNEGFKILTATPTSSRDTSGVQYVLQKTISDKEWKASHVK